MMTTDSARLGLKPAMQEAVEAFEVEGILYEVKTPYHVKIGKVNYYPTSQKVHVDGSEETGNMTVSELISKLKSGELK